MSNWISRQEIYAGVPVTNTTSSVITTSHQDHYGFSVVRSNDGNSTVAAISIWGSNDGTNWFQLQNTQQTINDSNTNVGIALQWSPWEYLRLQFDSVSAGGDSFTARIVGRGVR